MTRVRQARLIGYLIEISQLVSQYIALLCRSSQVAPYRACLARRRLDEQKKAFCYSNQVPIFLINSFEDMRLYLKSNKLS